MKFEEIYKRTSSRELSQVEAADILGVSERTFRRKTEASLKKHRVEGPIGASVNVALCLA